ncbi:MAG: hypothetical protein O3B47_03200 [bacterium]|nr:hypothetical protein [bacterium]
MFITLTLDTTRQNKSKIRLHKKKFNAASGWRKNIHSKKRNLFQRIKAWRRSLKARHYKLDGQVAMF